MSIASEITRLQTAKSDLATAIAAKGVTVPAATKLDGYAALVNSISAGGWLPPSAELVASAEETINLSSGTSFDSWTPTTTNTSILAAGSNRAACNYTITTDYQDTALIGFCMMNTEYAYTGSVVKGYPTNKIIYGFGHYSPAKSVNNSDEYYGGIVSGAMCRHTYYSSATALSVYAGTSFGIGPTGITFALSSNFSTTSRTIGFTRPAIYARCQSTYFSTTAAAALDSANTNIYCKYRIYKIDKTESPLYKMFDATNGIFFT